MNYIPIKKVATKWCISERRVQKLCEIGKIFGAEKFDFAWLISNTALKTDGRKTLAISEKECKNDE